MFASLALLALAQQVVIPLGKPPRQVERPVAPLAEAGPVFAGTCEELDEWDKPAPPVRIHGNTYLVGTCGISSILIAGTDGHILIDSGTEKGADLVAANVRKLGFRLRDVKILLHSHEHIDHVGGMARLQRLTGATVAASAAAAPVLQSGVASADDPQAGLFPPFGAVPVDRIVRDGDQIRLGNLALVALATPGHTPGALTWHWGSCDGGVCRRIVYSDSLSPISGASYRFSDHAAYLAAYRASLDKLRRIKCDILLTPHPSASRMAERMAGRAPLTDAAGCRDYADAIAKRLDERLAKEQPR